MWRDDYAYAHDYAHDYAHARHVKGYHQIEPHLGGILRSFGLELGGNEAAAAPLAPRLQLGAYTRPLFRST